MMYVELASSFDARDLPREAAWAYELAIQRAETTVDVYYDLVGLYFTLCDTGYVAAHRLEQQFAEVAYDRAAEVLDLAEQRFGRQPDIAFWRLYLREHVLGEYVPRETYLKLALSGGSDLPYLALYAASNRAEYVREVQPLVSASRLGRTARERYIRSIVM